MNETWGYGPGRGIWSLQDFNRGKAQRSGFVPEEEVQRNERDLALRAGARHMELAPTM